MCGDDYVNSILRKAEKELGITNINFEKSQKVFNDREYKFYNQYFRVVLQANDTKFEIKNGEITDIRWFDKSTLKKLVKEKSDLLIPGWIIPNELLQD